MAGDDRAGDDKAGDSHEGKQAAAPAAVSPKPAEAGTSAAEMTPSPALSEWTASDARGRLNEVGSVPEKDQSGPVYGEAVSPGEPEAVPPSATRSGSVEPIASARRASPWPVVAGLVVGALVGAGSAYLVYANVARSGDAGETAKVEALATQVAALERRPDPSAPFASLQAAVADLSGKVAALERAPPARSAAAPTSSTASTPGQPAPNDTADLQQKLATLQASVATMQRQSASASDLTAVQAKLAAIATGVADAQKQAAASHADVGTLQAAQKTLEAKAGSPALAVVADSLAQQISRGLPFAPQVNALEALGVEPAKIAILRQFADAGVPTATALAVKFDPLTDELLAAGNRVPANASFWERLKSGVAGLVSIHRVDAVSGNDVPSRIARIKADLQRDDVVDAVKTWEMLPADARGRPDAAAWGALAKTHAQAITAANAVEQAAIAALATKKS